MHFNLGHLLDTWGYDAVFAFVAVESLGIPFPGETMLITAGLYAGSTHKLAIWAIVMVAAAGAIVGDNIGYLIGRAGGYPLVRRYGPKVRLDEAKLKVGHWMFVHHGGKVVFFGRFVSILRTYAALLAGIFVMAWVRFLAFNAAGGILWACLYGIASYALGSEIDRLSRPLDYTLGGLAVVVFAAVVVFVRRNEARLEARAEAEMPGPLEAYLGRRQRGRGFDPARTTPTPPTAAGDCAGGAPRGPKA